MPDLPIAGIVWQVDSDTLHPHGNWERIGAHQLLVQWTAVDDHAFVANAGLPKGESLPDWQRIAAEPWAQEVILGLAGRFDENAARADIENLAAVSARLAQLPTPLNVVGWYFPVEVDPTWVNAHQLNVLLAQLPRPLWISVYDSANLGAEHLANTLAAWLPKDVGIFFQDGVGIYAREPSIARHYADVLAASLGKQRVRIIAEAFRPKQGGGFRSATLKEIKNQMLLYQGYSIYLFDGPHYVTDTLVEKMVNDQGVDRSIR